jgi:hypothetical protein
MLFSRLFSLLYINLYTGKTRYCIIGVYEHLFYQGDVMGFDSIFAGKMLGDGCINRNRRKFRFCFIHKLNDKGYADYTGYA